MLDMTYESTFNYILLHHVRLLKKYSYQLFFYEIYSSFYRMHSALELLFRYNNCLPVIKKTEDFICFVL